MDGRIALAPGAVLKLSTVTGYVLYTINREVGRGGWCIVYDASYTDNLGNYKLVRVKECYPHALRINRGENGELIAGARDAQTFAAAKERLIAAYQKNHDLFTIDGLTNTIANTSDIYQENDTVYIVSVYMNGKTFSDFQGETLHDCVALIRTVACVLQRIHEADYLYLDLKPDNILTLEGSLDLVQLFDFDSMISVPDLNAAIQSGDSSNLRTSYTKGYASLEQQTGKLRQLGKYSDVYSLGAVLFWALWHRTPSAFDCDADAEYDYAHMTYAGKSYQDRLFRALTEFFHKTLVSYYADRYQSMKETIRQLDQILRLSDEKKAFLISPPMVVPAFFAGRETELDELGKLLGTPDQRIFSLNGMGGIGKSTLVRAYLDSHREDYDAVLWLYDNGNAQQMIGDDLAVRISTVSRMKEEPLEDYLPRKMRALAEIVTEQHVLVVIDNVLPEHLNNLGLILNIGWDVLLISRAALSEGLYPSLTVGEMDPEALATLFTRYAHVEIKTEDDIRDFNLIANTVYGHTLTLELLGRQIARSYLTLREAARLVESAGFKSLPTEKIDYIHDQEAFMAPLTMILDRLVEIDRFSNDERQLLKIASIFELPGIRASLLRDISPEGNLDAINRLKDCGWLDVVSGRVAFHPMLKEYFDAWSWTEETLTALDQALVRLYKRINPRDDRPDLDKQFPEDYRPLYAMLSAAERLLVYTRPATPESQMLRFRMLMDAPVDIDEKVLEQMLGLLRHPDFLPPDCVLRLYETAAFMLGRLEYYQDAHELLKEMKGYLKKHPSHYYTSWYYRAKAVLTNNQYGREKDKKCLEYEDAAIKAARASKHYDAKRQLAGCLLAKVQTLLEQEKKMRLCGEMLSEADELLAAIGNPADYEQYHLDCVAAVYFARIGDEASSVGHIDRATHHADVSRDSPLSFIEHLVEEAAVAYIELGRYEDAIQQILTAIQLCDENEEGRRYRETRFDATIFLGRVYAMNEEYTKAEEAFREAEKRVSDSPYEWRLPLCPEDIREKAEKQRRMMRKPDSDNSDQGEQTMDTQKVTINGITIAIPDYYQKLEPKTDEMKGTLPYLFQTDHANCLALLSEVDASQSLPRTQDALIDGIRKFLGDKQGLIQAEACEDYAFSIVKTMMEPSGVQYLLTYQRFYPDSILNIQAFFEESGMTGMRDSIAYEICRREGLVGKDEDPFVGWTRDPYDETITEGALMNLSEHERFDIKFPGFPLSLCRKFVRTLEKDETAD